MVPLFLTLSILIFLVTLFLGLLVFLNDSKNQVNRTFLFITLFSIGWIVTNLIVDLSKDLKVALFFSRMTIVAPAFIAPTCLYFSLIFPRQKIKIKVWKIVLIFIPALIFLIFSPTKFNVEKVWLDETGKVDFQPGILYLLLLIYFIVYFGLTFRNFLKSHKENIGIEKIQIVYLFIGFLSAVIIGLTTNVILPLIRYSQFVTVGPSLSIFGFIGFTAYAIVARRLFDIKVILTEVFTVTVGLILFIQAIAAPSLVMKILNTGIFLLFCLFGYFLVKSVIREVELRQEVEKLSQAKSEFISIASHQLRTPLTAIKGYISMVLEKSYGKPPEKMEKPLENIYASNERLIKLVNDLLNLSRLEAGKIEFNPELTSLKELVSGIIQELRINVEKKGLYIKIVKPSEPLPKIMLDRDKIRQVILNIIDNAIKYTKEGGITVNLEKLNSEEQIKVSDTGEGMDEKEIQSLFQIFSRATAGTQLHTEGAGIGLYVARQFVEMHGGKIWAESLGKGKGSTFIVRLPIQLSPKLLKSKTRTIINK